MNKWLKVGIVGALALAAGVALVTGVAMAQEETETPATEIPFRFFGGKGFLRGMGMDGQAGLEAAATALGMTADELSTQLWGGKSLADVAEDQGVALEDVQAAVEAAQLDAMRQAIEQAVTDGTITREHADWLLEGVDNGYIGQPGIGMGFMRGGHGHGFKHFMLPGNLPDSSSSGDS